jgi:hypothetical protein
MLSARDSFNAQVAWAFAAEHITSEEIEEYLQDAT